MLRKNAIRIVRLATGICIFALLILWVGYENIASTFFSFNLVYLLPALLLFLAIFLINSINLKILLSPIKKLDLSFILKKYMLSWSLGFIFPGKLGEFSLSFLIKDKIAIGKSSAVLVIDKLVSFVVFLFFSIFPLIYFFGIEKTIHLIALLVGFTLFAGFFIITEKGRTILKKTILRWHQHLFEGFSKTFNEFLKKERKVILANFLFTIARLLVQTTFTLFIFLGFNQQVNFVLLMVVSAAVTIISAIPITVGGLGIRQGSMAFLLGLVGVPYATTISVSIIGMSIRYSFIAFVTYFFLSKKIREMLPL